MSTGNVPVVGNGGNVGVGGNTTRNSPTSVTDRKSKTTQDYNLTSGEWQKIPKVEIVQHVDSEEGSGKDSNPDSKLDSKEEEPRSDSSKKFLSGPGNEPAIFLFVVYFLSSDLYH